MQTQNKLSLRESQLAQRESHRGSFPLDSSRRETSPKTNRKCHESRETFVYFRDKLGMMQNVSLVEREC
jgi:hypothetical protein